MKLTADSVKGIVEVDAVQFSQFTDQSKLAFIDIWARRLHDARDWHKIQDLEDRARSILGFVANVGSADLRLYVDAKTKLGFLYDNSTKEFLAVAGDDR